jgi:hypothetical protein
MSISSGAAARSARASDKSRPETAGSIAGRPGTRRSGPSAASASRAKNLIVAALRLPDTFAVPRFGGRAWTTFGASLDRCGERRWRASDGHALDHGPLLA